MMRYLFAAILAVVLSCSNANAPSIEFKPYRVCVDSEALSIQSGRHLQKTGWVVDEGFDEEGKYFAFLSDDHPRSVKYVQHVRRVDRLCGVLQVNPLNN